MDTPPLPPQMDPYKTMLVVKDKTGKKVGEIPATATNATAYLNEMALFYEGLTVEYVYNEDAGILALLRSPAHFG